MTVLVNSDGGNAKGLFLIDLSWALLNGYYGLRNIVYDSHRTGHYLHLVNLVSAIIRVCPEYAIILCVDDYPKEKHELYSEYKAERPQKDIDTKNEAIKIAKMLTVLPFVYQASAQYQEADHVIANLSRIPLPVMIYAYDNDLLQLMTKRIRIVHKYRKLKFIELDEGYVYNKYGVMPEHLLMYRALTSDTSDNIKGYPRIPRKDVVIPIARKFKTPSELLSFDCDKIKDNKLSKWMRVIKARPQILKRNFKLMDLSVEINVKLQKYRSISFGLQCIDKYGLKGLKGLYEQYKIKADTD